MYTYNWDQRLISVHREIIVSIAQRSSSSDVLLMYSKSWNRFHSFICSLIVSLSGPSHFLAIYTLDSSSALNQFIRCKCIDFPLYIWLCARYTPHAPWNHSDEMISHALFITSKNMHRSSFRLSTIYINVQNYTRHTTSICMLYQSSPYMGFIYAQLMNALIMHTTH